MTSRLPLHAEFLLLAHDDRSGRPLIDSTHLKAGLAGAAVTELTLQEALRLEGDGRSARLHATGRAVAPELEEALARADGRSPKDAVARIGGGRSWRDRAGHLEAATLAGLEGAGVGVRGEQTVLGVFHRKVWREQDPAVEREIVERLRNAVRATGEPDTRTAVLVSLLSATGLLRKVLPEQDKRVLAARAKEISAGQWGGQAVATAIQEVEAAVVAAVVAAGAAGASS
ncbi:GPP34 family phosphoprotein [Intrasporangium sp.]|uniref:GOLPH3/VPS74 family protein n=1 Tax=Intrasporangium sp. TaxID=1925024 RepID=UPI0032214FB2